MPKITGNTNPFSFSTPGFSPRRQIQKGMTQAIEVVTKEMGDLRFVTHLAVNAFKNRNHTSRPKNTPASSKGPHSPIPKQPSTYPSHFYGNSKVEASDENRDPNLNNDQLNQQIKGISVRLFSTPSPKKRLSTKAPLSSHLCQKSSEEKHPLDSIKKNLLEEFTTSAPVVEPSNQKSESPLLSSSQIKVLNANLLKLEQAQKELLEKIQDFLSSVESIEESGSLLSEEFSLELKTLLLNIDFKPSRVELSGTFEKKIEKIRKRLKHNQTSKELLAKALERLSQEIETIISSSQKSNLREIQQQIQDQTEENESLLLDLLYAESKEEEPSSPTTIAFASPQQSFSPSSWTSSPFSFEDSIFEESSFYVKSPESSKELVTNVTEERECEEQNSPLSRKAVLLSFLEGVLSKMNGVTQAFFLFLASPVISLFNALAQLNDYRTPK